MTGWSYFHDLGGIGAHWHFKMIRDAVDNARYGIEGYGVTTLGNNVATGNSNSGKLLGVVCIPQ